MPDFKTPGVYIEEINPFPPSIAQVETAIPVFIGYTEKAVLKEAGDLLNKPFRINSLNEYRRYFGEADFEKHIAVAVDTDKSPVEIAAKNLAPSNYLMSYSLQAFYANGGGPCYIVSVGDYSGNGVIKQAALLDGLKEAAKVDEITLIVFPDGTRMEAADDYYKVINQALGQCNELQDRFTVCDVIMHNDAAVDDAEFFRKSISGTADELKYGAAYYPYLEMLFDFRYKPEDVKVIIDGNVITLDTLEAGNNALFNKVKSAINNLPMVLPPSSAIVGIYAQIDNNRGVWKAPANVNVDFAIKPVKKITDQEQEGLNVDVSAGKSINAIRSFAGRGPAIVWGARTLAGNDNDWRYIPVRRFFNMVEESVKKATFAFVFEPNDSDTWIKIKAMIENFLTLQWRAGALAGSTPGQAYFVRVGLNETMTAQDILEGRLYVEIGIAVVRPAEFIILQFMHKMQES